MLARPASQKADRGIELESRIARRKEDKTLVRSRRAVACLMRDVQNIIDRSCSSPGQKYPPNRNRSSRTAHATLHRPRLRREVESTLLATTLGVATARQRRTVARPHRQPHSPSFQPPRRAPVPQELQTRHKPLKPPSPSTVVQFHSSSRLVRDSLVSCPVSHCMGC